VAVIGLCLLSVLFAMEAKIAWYNPAGEAHYPIQSSKARPADTATAMSQDAPIQAPFPPQMFLVVAAFLVAAPAVMLWEQWRRAVLHCIPAVSLFSFSPGLFFRPPPAL
jgi:hypothetical protein